MKPIKFSDIGSDPHIEQRVSFVVRERSEIGRSSVDFECAFCHSMVRAYLWSLSGSGKRCPNCGSLIASGGRTYGRSLDVES